MDPRFNAQSLEALRYGKACLAIPQTWKRRALIVAWA